MGRAGYTNTSRCFVNISQAQWPMMDCEKKEETGVLGWPVGVRSGIYGRQEKFRV